MDANNVLEDKLLRAVLILASNELKDEREAIEALGANGFSILDSERLFFSIQLAFGRAVLSRLGVAEFPDKFILDTANGIEIERDLINEPFFAVASSVAVRTFAEGFLPKHIFQAVVIWSSELRAANEALNSGANISGSKLLRPTWHSSLEAQDWKDI